jgi:hypothetical protein
MILWILDHFINRGRVLYWKSKNPQITFDKRESYGLQWQGADQHTWLIRDDQRFEMRDQWKMFSSFNFEWLCRVSLIHFARLKCNQRFISWFHRGSRRKDPKLRFSWIFWEIMGWARSELRWNQPKNWDKMEEANKCESVTKISKIRARHPSRIAVELNNVM